MTLRAPEAPDFVVPWADLDRTFDWIHRMRDCPQDPLHHAEGDVWIHTRMVCEAMAAHPAWRALGDDDRSALWLAALFHDVAKPDCTRIEPDGRIHSRGHSRRGAILTRQILWRMGFPFARRERIAALVSQHQAPFFLVDRADAQSLALGLSVALRCDELALLAESDARGRTCADQQRLVDNVALFREYCGEQGCLEGAWAFPSDHARFAYFQRLRAASGGSGPAPSPHHDAHDPARCEVVVMSGLPASGKDAWVAANLRGWPVVSLDDLRDELGVDPKDAQGAVIQAARERAREHLRAGRSFVWNATNLSRLIRAQCIQLAASYGARIRIVYVEASPSALFRRNRERARVVPDAVIEKLLDRWEIPDATEAHRVDWVIDPSP
jgi:predicted kinase